MSKMSQALRSLFVSLMSATLGAGVPLGWLWNYTDCLVIPNNSVMRLYSAFSKSGLG